MANYKNTRGRSNAQQRRSSSGDILKTLGAVLVVFLAIGLIGSLFSRPFDSADADKNNPTEPVELITFTFDGVPYTCEAGMTWNDFTLSDFNTGGFVAYFEDNRIYSEIRDAVCYQDGTEVAVLDEILSGHGYIPD